MARHDTEITFVATWSEYLAACSCGWTGTYMTTRRAAEAEAKEHVRKESDG